MAKAMSLKLSTNPPVKSYATKAIPYTSTNIVCNNDLKKAPIYSDTPFPYLFFSKQFGHDSPPRSRPLQIYNGAYTTLF